MMYTCVWCIYMSVCICVCKKKTETEGGQVLISFPTNLNYFLGVSEDLFLIENRACANWLLTFSFAYLNCFICR